MKPLRKSVGWDVVWLPYNNTRILPGWILDMILEKTQRGVEGHCEIINHEGIWLTEALHDYLYERGF